MVWPASQRLEQRLSVFGRLALRPSDEPVAQRMAAYVQFIILEKRPGDKFKLMRRWPCAKAQLAPLP